MILPSSSPPRTIPEVRSTSSVLTLVSVCCILCFVLIICHVGTSDSVTPGGLATSSQSARRETYFKQLNKNGHTIETNISLFELFSIKSPPPAQWPACWSGEDDGEVAVSSPAHLLSTRQCVTKQYYPPSSSLCWMYLVEWSVSNTTICHLLGEI